VAAIVCVCAVTLTGRQHSRWKGTNAVIRAPFFRRRHVDGHG
jgi:hypothetical protein